MTSKRRNRCRRCLGKKHYDTVRPAALGAAALSRRDRAPVVAYRCPRCGGIHGDHMPHRAAPSPTLAPTQP